MSRDLITLTRLGKALTDVAGDDAEVTQLDRHVITRFLGVLVEEGLTPNGRNMALSSASKFFTAARQHEWLPGLPARTDIYSEDFPPRTELPPRGIPEFVMAQLEDPANLDKLIDPRWRLLFPLLIEPGLRLRDARRLDADCVVHDQQRAPYLRYFNHKMDREALVPISTDLAAGVQKRQQLLHATYPAGCRLFPSLTRNPTGRHPSSGGCAHKALKTWLAACDVRDEHGHPFHLTPHQFRHTLGTRLINNDVPQEVVRRILDHTSTAMTAHYARLHDTTVRQHWERARKVDIHGQPVHVNPDSPLADASWMKQHLGRATMALSNGYCGLPIQQTCPHANACLTCPVFITTPEFLPHHKKQLDQTRQIINHAEQAGQIRVVEMNQRIADNLTNIITALNTEDDVAGDAEQADPDQSEAGNAR